MRSDHGRDLRRCAKYVIESSGRARAGSGSCAGRGERCGCANSAAYSWRWRATANAVRGLPAGHERAPRLPADAHLWFHWPAAQGPTTDTRSNVMWVMYSQEGPREVVGHAAVGDEPAGAGADLDARAERDGQHPGEHALGGHPWRETVAASTAVPAARLTASVYRSLSGWYGGKPERRPSSTQQARAAHPTASPMRIGCDSSVPNSTHRPSRSAALAGIETKRGATDLSPTC